MRPAAVLGTLVKVEGMSLALTQMKQFDNAGRKASVSSDKLSSSVDKQQKSHRALSGALGTVTKAAVGLGLVAGGVLAMGFRAGYREMQQAQLAAAQTQAVIKSTGGVARVSAKQVDSLAASLMSKSGVDDEVIKSGENMLLTFTHIHNEVGKGNNIFDQATTAVLDMSVAMGKPMKQTAIMVGKALQDPIKGVTALRRVGVMLTDQQTKQVKAMVESGNVMGAQKIILKELNTEFGGSAIAAGKTLPGQLNILKETFKNVAGSIVTGLVPVLMIGARGLIAFINGIKTGTGVGGAFATGIRAIAAGFVWLWNAGKQVVAFISGLVHQFQLGNPLVVALGGALGGAAIALTAVAIALRIAATAQALFNIVATANPYVLIIVAIAAFIAALIALYMKVKVVRDFMNAAWLSIKTTAIAVWSFLLPYLASIWNAILAVAGPIFKLLVSIVSAAPHALASAWAWAQTAVANAIPVISSIIGTLSTVFGTVFSVIRGVMTPVIILFSNVFGTAIKVAVGIAVAAFNQLKTVAVFVWTIIGNAFRAGIGIVSSVFNAIVAVISGVLNIIRGIVNVFAGLFTGDFGRMWKGIKQIFSGALQVVIGIVKGTWGALRAAGTLIMEGLTAGIKAVWGTIKNVIHLILNSVVSIAKGFWNTLYNVGAYLIKGIAKGIASAINFVIRSIVGWLNDIVWVVNKLLGALHISKVANITAPQISTKGYAKGGVVTSPGYFAGEEAPRHKEYIITENPAYRQRNLPILAAASKALGVSNGAPGFAAGGVYGGRPTLNQGQLKALWIAANPGLGNPDLMAAIAMAESRGRDVINSIGATGYWQIHPGGSQYLDPMTNARAAGDKLRNPGLSAWEAYTNGSYKQFMGGKGLVGTLLSGLLNAAGILVPGIGMVKTVADVMKKMPKPVDLKSMFNLQGLPQAILNQVKGFVESKIGDLLGGLGGPATHLGKYSATWAGIDALAKQFGMIVTSGYRPGGKSWHAAGRARDYAGSATGMNAFAQGVARAYGMQLLEEIHNPNVSIKNGQNVPPSFWGADTWAQHANHVHIAFEQGGIYDYAGKFGSGGAVTATKPTMAMFGDNGPETAFFVPHYQTGGDWASKITNPHARYQMYKSGVLQPPKAPALATPVTTGGLEPGWLGDVIGMPAQPKIAGTAPNTFAGAAKIQGTINSLTSRIAPLQHRYDILDQYYALSTPELLDPVTGERNEGAISERLNELNKLADIARQIFTLYQQIAAWTQFLIQANQNIINVAARKRDNANKLIGGFKKSLSAIHLKGLKGASLKSAQAHQKNLNDSVTKYGKVKDQAVKDVTTFTQNRDTAKSDLTSALDSRDSQWLSVLRLMGEIDGVKATKANVTAAAGIIPTDIQTQDAQKYTNINIINVPMQKGGVFAGAFAKGGVYTADRPTWALFGEGAGRETATFTPGGGRSSEAPLVYIGEMNVASDFDERALAHKLAFLLEM